MNAPVFVLSAGWRSGSTLLQRMITASGKVLVWGEAGGALDNFADALEKYLQMLGPGGKLFKHGPGGNGEEQYVQFKSSGKDAVHKWIACLNPPLDYFLQAFRMWMDTVYARPAAELGYGNWGIKEVQSGTVAANFLRQLYPDARFVFLVRNPIDCLTSIKRRNWLGHHGTADPVTYYGNHWTRLAREFREANFGYLVRYEDLLTSSERLDDLSRYLGIAIAPDFIKQSRADWGAENDSALSFLERRRLLRIARSEMEEYGYR